MARRVLTYPWMGVGQNPAVNRRTCRCHEGLKSTFIIVQAFRQNFPHIQTFPSTFILSSSHFFTLIHKMLKPVLLNGKLEATVYHFPIFRPERGKKCLALTHVGTLAQSSAGNRRGLGWSSCTLFVMRWSVITAISSMIYTKYTKIYAGTTISSVDNSWNWIC